MERGRTLRAVALAVSAAPAGCAPPPPVAPTAPSLSDFESAATPALQSHAIIGFSVDSPARAATAAREGITTTILYGGSPPPGSALARALQAHAISVIDGGVSGLMFYWECHRTHTVKPPPKSYGYNSYWRTDEHP